MVEPQYMVVHKVKKSVHYRRMVKKLTKATGVHEKLGTVKKCKGVEAKDGTPIYMADLMVIGDMNLVIMFNRRGGDYCMYWVSNDMFDKMSDGVAIGMRVTGSCLDFLEYDWDYKGKGLTGAQLKDIKVGDTYTVNALASGGHVRGVVREVIQHNRELEVKFDIDRIPYEGGYLYSTGAYIDLDLGVVMGVSVISKYTGIKSYGE